MRLEGEYFRRLSEEERILCSHIADLADICEEKHIPRFTAFLDINQIEIARSVLGNIGFDEYDFFGGYDGAQRCELGLFPPYSDKRDFPITALNIEYRRDDRLSHRDFLGAFMSCGINRNTVGDIVVNEGNAIAFVYDTVVGTILNDVRKIGSVGVKISETISPEITAEANFNDISGTVSSLRTDCIISLALRISREKAAQLIKGGSVIINCRQQLSASHDMKCGDVFSIRGYGKFVLYEIGGFTKKNRIRITVKKYI